MILTDWFVPGYKAGGPIQSCYNLAMGIKDKYEIYVFTSDCDLGEVKPYANVISNQWSSDIDEKIQVYYCSEKNLKFSTIRSLINEIVPDFVYLNHMFSFRFVLIPLFLNWARLIKSNVVICPRGALFKSALHYQHKFLKKITVLTVIKWLGVCKKVRFHATNKNEKDSILKYFPNNEIMVVDNLPAAVNRQSVQMIEKVKGSLKCVFAARILPIKNLLYFINVLKLTQCPIELNIVGPIEDIQYWAKCEIEIKRMKRLVRINYLGALPNNQLREVIKENHLYILPSEGENFGHSIIEALQAGRPVMISDRTPWRNLQGKKIGWDLPLSNPIGYLNALQEAFSWDQNEFAMYSQNAKNFADSIDNLATLEKYKTLFS